MNKLIVSKVYTIEIESEIHCDDCNEIVHNHIEECPICHTKYASTDASCDLNNREETIIQCEECNTYFKLVDGYWYGIFDEDEILENPYLWESLSPKVIVVDPPIIEKVIAPKSEYKVDPKLIETMKNFKLFEPLINDEFA